MDIGLVKEPAADFSAESDRPSSGSGWPAGFDTGPGWDYGRIHRPIVINPVTIQSLRPTPANLSHASVATNSTRTSERSLRSGSFNRGPGLENSPRG